MNSIAEMYRRISEPYAMGLFEEPDKGYFYRHSLGLARYFEALPPAKYEPGELLYPMGNKFYSPDFAVKPQFCVTYEINFDRIEQKDPEAVAPLREFYAASHWPGGFTHAAPNYRRIVREGLASYRERTLAQPESEFRTGLLVLLDALESYVKRSVEYLRSVGAPRQLIQAMEHVPFYPARTYYEGLVAWNLIFYFDGADNLGCLDDGLDHLYAGEDLTHVIAQLFDNINTVGTWSCTVGTVYNAITEQALYAVRGRRRPMLELMVRDNMPEHYWDIAIENLRSGCTHPSFYNARGIHDMLKEHFPYIPDEELNLFCGCGCTETNLQGITRAGGTDENMPLLLHFRRYLHEHLAEVADFDEFYTGFCAEIERLIDELIDRVVDRYEYMAEYLPNPMRTLFTDDCIEKGKDFNGGGARYTWTQNSDSGLINTIDSLLAVRELVFEKKRFTPAEFIEKLDAEDPAFYAILKKCPCYGVDDERADALAADFTNHAYSVHRRKPLRSFIDGYLITEHQFSRYEYEGSIVGPTPDGRKASEPTCDSIASLRGKAIQGPTAMLRSASKLPQHLAEGISVLNLTLNKNFVGEPLKALVKAYFAMGGIQVQVSVVSIEELQDALVHPEKHQDLVVRVGGYSEYFVRLTPALQKAVLERNIHELGG